jgi:hypothetical protein
MLLTGKAGQSFTNSTGWPACCFLERLVSLLLPRMAGQNATTWKGRPAQGLQGLGTAHQPDGCQPVDYLPDLNASGRGTKREGDRKDGN